MSDVFLLCDLMNMSSHETLDKEVPNQAWICVYQRPAVSQNQMTVQPGIPAPKLLD